MFSETSSNFQPKNTLAVEAIAGGVVTSWAQYRLQGKESLQNYSTE
jgi:hypothetical protein